MQGEFNVTLLNLKLQGTSLAQFPIKPLSLFIFD